MKQFLYFITLTVLSYVSLSVITQRKRLVELVKEKHIPGSELNIYIEKKKRRLSVIYKDSTLISYPCVLGFEPEGDKQMEGDGKTPEGNFGIRSMYPHKSWSYFIWIDYPNEASWKKFNARKKKGSIPKDAKIGGEIGIHGVPTGYDDLIHDKNDWTLGCISLKTADITDLYKSISKESKIVIVP